MTDPAEKGEFDLGALLAERGAQRYELHTKYLNHQLPRMLHTIGFDKVYERAEGAHFWDADGNDYLDMLAGFGVAMGLGRRHRRPQGAARRPGRLARRPHPLRLPAAARAPRRESARAQSPPGAGVLRQQRYGGGGDRAQVRPVRHREDEDPLLFPRLPRTDHRLTVRQRRGRLPRRLRPAAARHRRSAR